MYLSEMEEMLKLSKIVSDQLELFVCYKNGFEVLLAVFRAASLGLCLGSPLGDKTLDSAFTWKQL